ncbi:hypothetical protein FF2_023591 [Malus domestica]
MGWSLMDKDDSRLPNPSCPVNCSSAAPAFPNHWGPVSRGTGLEIQAGGEVEDEGFVVVQNIDMDDEIMYRHPCMVNVTGIGK